MSAAAARLAGPAARSRAGDPRRAVISDHAGRRLGEVPLGIAAGARLPVRPAAARVLVGAGANWSDRPPTGDALHLVLGRRACFGYVADVDRVCWFSHPRVAGVDAFAPLADREVRSLLYDLHAGDPDTVSEIIWETSGRIFAHRAPALPAGIDPRARGSLERELESAAYCRAIVQVLTAGARGEIAHPRHGPGRAAMAGRPRVPAPDQPMIAG